MTAEVLPLMSPEVARRLDRFEAEIEAEVGRGWSAAVTIGRDLRTIRDERLYPDASFELYLKRRWNYDRRRAYQFIDAAHIQDAIVACTNVHVAIPSEAVGRELVPLLRDEHGSKRVAEAWTKIAERYDSDFGPLTARSVRRFLVTENFRTQFGRASGGKPNLRVLLGQCGDKIEPARRRLYYFLTRELRDTPPAASVQTTAARYAVWCHDMALVLDKLAQGETPTADDTEALR